MKTCRACQQEKPLTEFYRWRSNGNYKLDCKPCQSASIKQYKAEKGYSKSYRNTNWLVMTARAAAGHAIRRAAKKGVPCNITSDYLASLVTDSNGVCALSGLPFLRTPQPGIANPMSPSIDRVRPELGYTIGNVRFILHALNDLKGSGTDEDVIRICHAVAERHPL